MRRRRGSFGSRVIGYVIGAILIVGFIIWLSTR